MANKRFGWHSGSLKCRDITVESDLTIEGSMTFGDASTDTLTVNGAATFTSTVGITGAMTITGDVGLTGNIDMTGKLDVSDEQDGGAANGSIIKKTLQAGEDYTTTTAGLMVKNYGDATATVSSGEFTGLYVNLKGLHVDPGNNTSIISAHVHASNTTTVHAGVWLYGDMTNGLKMSGSTLTSAIDISEATAVTNIFSVPAAGTAPVTANALVPSAAPDAGTVGADACLTVDVGGTPYYIALYDTLHA